MREEAESGGASHDQHLDRADNSGSFALRTEVAE